MRLQALSVILVLCAALSMTGAAPAKAERIWDAVQSYRLGQFAQARLAFADLAAKGEPKAFFWLGLLMQRGHGGPTDMAKAYRSYQAGAYLGDGRSMHRLGLMYRDGRLGAPNRPLALAWFKLGARTGDRSAIRNARDLDLFSPPAIRNESDVELYRLEGEIAETDRLYRQALGPNRLTALPALREAMEVLHREFYTP